MKETLERIVETGVDRERLHACFNRYSFAMRETSGDMPRSVAEACDLLDTWLYGGDPADGLCVEEVLGELKNRLDTPYFTELIREVFLENPHFQTVILVPSADIPEKEFIFTDTEREALEAETEAMYTWQSIPDSEEARASIPRLELSDLNETPVPLIYTEKTEYGATVLTHAVRTRTALVRAHFNAADLRADELPKLALALRLLGGIGTERHDRSSLPLAVMNTFGRLDFYPTAIEGKSGTRLLLTASFACLPELAADAFALLAELLLETDWTDVPLLRELLGQTEYGARLSLTAEGQSFALRKAGSHAASHTAANEWMSGVSFLEHVTALSEADDETLTAYLAELGAIVKRLITRQRLTLSVTENVDAAGVNAFLAALPSRAESVPVETDYIIAGPQAEGIPISSDVGFAVMAGSLKATGTPYSGSMPVLASILNYTHLWYGIRLAGGAYGCGFEAVPNGDLYFFSNRDPNPANSLAVFQSSGDFIRGWLETAPDLTGYILGSVSSVDPLRTPEHAISAAETRFFTGMTNADAERRYRELLGTKPEDIRKLAELLDAFTKTGYLCVAADKAALADCGISKENCVKESQRS